MRKKLLSFALTMFLLPFTFFLSSCGEIKLESIFFIDSQGEKQYSGTTYNMGSFEVGVSNEQFVFSVYAKYSNGKEIELLENEYNTTVYFSNSYSNTPSQSEEIPESLEIGSYTINFEKDGLVITILFQIMEENFDILDISGNYAKVDITADLELPNLPKYMQFLSYWGEQGVINTLNYKADFLFEYESLEEKAKIAGVLQNVYDDSSKLQNFSNDGSYEFNIKSAFEVYDYIQSNSKNYYMQGLISSKGNSLDFYNINEETHCSTIFNYDSLIFNSTAIDFPYTSLKADSLTYFVCEDEQFVKIKAIASSENNETIIIFVFNSQGEFVGQSVSYQGEELKYSIQLKINDNINIETPELFNNESGV